jgi:HSP20 family protein
MTTPQHTTSGDAKAPPAAPSSTDRANTASSLSSTQADSTASNDSASATAKSSESRAEGRKAESGAAKSSEQMESRQTKTDDRRLVAHSSSRGLLRWGLPPSPWELLRRMSEDIDRAAGSLKDARAGERVSAQRSLSLVPTASSDGMDPMAWIPVVEVVRQPKDVVVRVDLPGVSPDEIDITIDDGLLTVAGERSREERVERNGFVRSERSYGSFARTIILPDGIDESRIEAKMDKGVLEIDIPLAGESRSRRIEVTS